MMKNSEKYTTAKERSDAFFKDVSILLDDSRYEIVEKFCHWLDLEAPAEEPLPCPFCGAKTSVYNHQKGYWCWVKCENQDCGYSSAMADSEAEVIANHNRVARAAAKGKEAN